MSFKQNFGVLIIFLFLHISLFATVINKIFKYLQKWHLIQSSLFSSGFVKAADVFLSAVDMLCFLAI